jgi:hypothetical protein
LWSLDRNTCARTLGALVRLGVLSIDENGQFMKAHGGY